MDTTLLRIFYYSIYPVINSLLSPLYWVVVIILILQYRRISNMEKDMMGSTKEPIYRKVITSIIVGFLGGIIGSIVFMVFETSIQPDDFKFILPIALILSLIHPRFICFSYAGGLLSLISLVFGRFSIDVSSIMTIIAVLHLIESFLIIINGHEGKMPIFMDKDGRIVGGFNMMRFWPVPFVVAINNGGFTVPLTVIAVLGYGDFALTKYPKEKSKETAFYLFLFSIILLLFSQLSIKYYYFKYIASVFAPVAHESVIQIGRKREKHGKAIFLPSNRGIKILDTMAKGVGEKMGLNSGDIILSLNGKEVNSIEEVKDILHFIPFYIWLDVYDNKLGRVVTKEYWDYKIGIRSLDVLIIPKDPDYSFVVEESEGLLNRLYKKVKRTGK